MFLSVYNPLQQPSTVLQGSSQPLQGSTPVLQAQPAATVAPTAPKQPVAKPKAPAPTQPAVTDLSARYGLYNGTVYDKGTNAGLSLDQFTQATGIQNPNWQALKFDTAYQPVQQPGVPQPDVQLTPEQQLAQFAGAANLSVEDLTKLIALTPQERSSVLDQYGIPALEKAAYALPAQSTQQIYNDAYAAAGLKAIKDKFTALQDQINKKHQELTAELGEVNENPWLSEASRIGRVKRLQELAQGEIDNLVNEAQQYADLYNQGLSEVQTVVTNTTTDFSNNQKLNAAKLEYMLKQAETQLQTAQQGKLARYLPDYLSAKTTAAGPKTVTAGDGSTWVWNNGKFVQMTAPKLQSVGKSSMLIDPATGEIMFTGIGSSGSGARLDSTTLTKVQTVANQFDNEPIVKEYNTIAGQIDFVKGAKTTPTDDISRVYVFAKVMDPNSVVREGEYKTVQDYSTALLQRFGLNAKRVFVNDGFLTDEARRFMQDTLQRRLETSSKQYQNVYTEYARRIDKLTGNADGKDYITNYGNAFSATPGSTPSNVDSLLSKYGLN